MDPKHETSTRDKPNVELRQSNASQRNSQLKSLQQKQFRSYQSSFHVFLYALEDKNISKLLNDVFFKSLLLDELFLAYFLFFMKNV